MKNELIYKYLEGNATPAEEQDVLSWISESEANKAEFCEIRALWSVRDRNSVENDPQRILKSLKALHARIDADASPHRSKRARIIRWAGWSAAAMLGVALVVGGYLVGHDMHKAAMESYYTFTNTGRKPESLRLLDGTQVWLAQGSTLSYGKTFSPHDRTVKLDGEAFFDVASDRDHPFFVKTNTVVVKVVGTSFNVKMYKDTDDSSASHDISISEVNVEYLMLLKYGMISMSDVRVAEIIRKVEEIYSVDIETVAPLDDDRLYNFNFLKSNTLDDVLDIIEKMSGVKCRPAPAAGAE